LIKQKNIIVLVTKADNKIMEDGTIQRQMSGIYNIRNVHIDELIEIFQPWRRGAPGGGSTRHSPRFGGYGYENCTLPSFYSPPLSRPVITPAIYHSNVNPNQFVSSLGRGLRQPQTEVARSQQLHVEYPNNFPKFNKFPQEDHTKTDNLLNASGLATHNLNPGQTMLGNHRWNFQGHMTPPVVRTNRGLIYPIQQFRRSRLNTSDLPGQRQRARHSSLMTPEGTYIPFDKFVRARTPSAQIVFHSDMAYSPAEQITNLETHLQHSNQKLFTMENTVSNAFPSPTENIHEPQLDGLNMHAIDKQRKINGLSEEKLSESPILTENFVNAETKAAEKPFRCKSAPLESLYTSYPLTIKNLASYNKQVTPFKGDYKTIVRRWLNKSFSN
jgi:hypothetical protein